MIVSTLNLQLAATQIPVAQAQTLTVSQPIIQPIPVKLENPQVINIPVKKSPVKITFASLPPVLKKIAKCESGSRQYYANGKVVTNKVTHDYGLFQINKQHIPTAKKLGYDIMTESGNIKFALYLYNRNGVADWSASSQCWQA